MKVFRGRIVDTPSESELRIRENNYMVVNNGTIEYIGETLPGQYDNENVTELQNGEFLMPGFVDCHAHPPQYAFVGTAFGLPLLKWLEATVHKFEPKCADTEYAEKLYSKFINKVIENGTTTGAYFATIHKESTQILADICERNHFRAYIGKVNQNMSFPPNLTEDTEDSIRDTIDFIDALRDYKYVKPIITPRFAVSCSRDLMTRLGELAAERDVFMQTHLSESPGECELIQDMYPECENYTDVYSTYKCLNSKTLLAHSIHLSESEMKVIRSKGASIVHCPNANLVMKSGFCMVKKALEKGMKVGMGTDVAGGCSVSMIEAMKLSLIVGNINNIIGKETEGLSLSQVIYLATLGGAKCLDLNQQIGSFEIGKQFDCIRVNLDSHNSPIDLFEWNTSQQMIERFILQGDSRNIAEVYIDGCSVKQ